MSQLLNTSEKPFACRRKRLSRALSKGVQEGVVAAQSSSSLAFEHSCETAEISVGGGSTGGNVHGARVLKR